MSGTHYPESPHALIQKNFTYKEAQKCDKKVSISHHTIYTVYYKKADITKLNHSKNGQNYIPVDCGLEA